MPTTDVMHAHFHDLKVCKEAFAFCYGKSSEEMWATAVRGDWMAWWIFRCATRPQGEARTRAIAVLQAMLLPVAIVIGPPCDPMDDPFLALRVAVAGFNLGCDLTADVAAEAASGALKVLAEHGGDTAQTAARYAAFAASLRAVYPVMPLPLEPLA